MSDETKTMVKSPVYRTISLVFGLVCLGIVIKSGADYNITMLSMMAGVSIIGGVKGQ